MQGLPTELGCKVFKYVDLKTKWLSCMRVDRAWRRMVLMPESWEVGSDSSRIETGSTFLLAADTWHARCLYACLPPAPPTQLHTLGR